MAKKAILIDKDGTLIPDIPYNVNPDKITLAEGSELLKELQELGFLLVVVTNQSGIARGYFPEKAIKAVELKIIELLEKNHVQLHGFFYCPHHPDGSVPDFAVECGCRKPGSGMLINASQLLDIDLSMSWMIGDILNDVEAGNRCGCRTVLIDNGNETEWVENEFRKPTYMSSDLRGALEYIIKQEILPVVKE